MFATIQIVLCVILILLLLLFPQTAHSGTDLGLNLFMEALFPYLLPYLVLTQWLLRLTAPMRTKTKELLYTYKPTLLVPLEAIQRAQPPLFI